MPSIALPVSLRGQLLNSTRIFNPVTLFAANEPGVWYDPSDLTTLFQDTAGTTPVTTPGQTVALALDKSKGLVLGSELVTNGDFSSGTTGWTPQDGNVVLSTSGGAGVATYTATSTFYQGVSVQAGKTYRATAIIKRDSGSGTPFMNFRSGTTLASGVLGESSSTGYTSSSYMFASAWFVAASTTTVYLHFPCTAAATTVASIDNISVKELPGFHATQATLASRPTYGIVPRTGRRNLELRTQDFSNAYWAKSGGSITSSTQTAPDGTATACTLTGNGTGFVAVQGGSVASGTATQSWHVKAETETKCEIWNAGSVSLARFDLSAVTAVNTNGTGAFITSLGNGWFRIGVSSGSYSGGTRLILGHNGPTLSTSMQIWGVQVETGSTATAYQRVGSAFDVTEAGVASLSYLSFDGVDDFMVTPTITPGIDKAQVFAGVRKLSDAARAMLVESGATGTDLGSFGLNAPRDATRFYLFTAGGSLLTSSQTTSSAFAAPVTNVISALANIAGDTNEIRLNGVQAGTTTGDQGTGNFAALPLYIGRRGGTTLPFNGQIFSLIVRFGTNLDAGTITSTETWVNGKTGAYA